MTLKQLLYISAILAIAIGLLVSSYAALPSMSDAEWAKMTYPSDMQTLRQTYAVIKKYQVLYPYRIAYAYAALYIVLQTFSIPGSIFLSIAGGALFGVRNGVLMVAFVAASGATGAYLISENLLGGVVRKLVPAERLNQFRRLVRRKKDSMFFFIVALRITPLLPNWFINLCSPIVGVRVGVFWLGTFVGVSVPSFFFVRAGTTLDQLVNARDALGWSEIASLFAMGLLSLIPTLPSVQRKLIGKID